MIETGSSPVMNVISKTSSLSSSAHLSDTNREIFVGWLLVD